MNMKGTDQENIKKYVFQKWRDVYNYHEHPNNPDGWKDCFLQRKFTKPFRLKQLITRLILAETIYKWRHNSKTAKKFDGGKSAHVLLKGRPCHSKDDTDQFGLY